LLTDRKKCTSSQSSDLAHILQCDNGHEQTTLVEKTVKYPDGNFVTYLALNVFVQYLSYDAWGILNRLVPTQVQAVKS
jgi:hypothetical protein